MPILQQQHRLTGLDGLCLSDAVRHISAHDEDDDDDDGDDGAWAARNMQRWRVGFGDRVSINIFKKN